MMLMKIKEKGVEREHGKNLTPAAGLSLGDGAVILSRAAAPLLKVEPCTMRA